MDKKKEQLLIDTIANQIIQASNTKVNKSAIDRTYEATIIEVLFNENTIKTDSNYNKYRVRYGNSEQDIVIDDGNAHSVNEKVYITAPCNNLSKKIINADNCIMHPEKLKYEDGEIVEYYTYEDELYKGTKKVTIDKITEYWKIISEYEKDAITDKYVIDEETKKMKPMSVFEMKREYKLLVKDKGLDTEECLALIFPDKSFMLLEGFGEDKY